MLGFIIGLFIGVGLFYLGAYLGQRRGIYLMYNYYTNFIRQLPIEIKIDVKRELRHYAKKRVSMRNK